MNSSESLFEPKKKRNSQKKKKKTNIYKADMYIYIMKTYAVSIIVHKTEDNWEDEQFPAFTDDHPPSNKGEASPLSTRTKNKHTNIQKKN